MTDYSAMVTDRKLDPVRARLLERAQEKNITFNELSLGLDKNRGYLENFVRKGSPVDLDSKDAIALATRLGIEPKELGVEGIVVDKTATVVAPNNDPAVTYVGEDRHKGERDLPIRGYAKGGELGFFFDNGDLRGYAVRPKNLEGVTDAYAVRLHSDSMSPIESGYVLKVDPSRPPRRGDNVVVELQDGQAFFKQLVRKSEKIVVCLQFNPRKEVEWKADKVKSIHVVVDFSAIE